MAFVILLGHYLTHFLFGGAPNFFGWNSCENTRPVIPRLASSINLSMIDQFFLGSNTRFRAHGDALENPTSCTVLIKTVEPEPKQFWMAGGKNF